MTRWLALFAMALTVGCGAAPSVNEDPVGGAQPKEPSWSGPVGAVSLPIIAGTSLAKVIVRRGDVYDPPPYYDEDADEEIDPPPAFTELFRYVTNMDPATTTLSLPHGNNYTIEVIAGGAESGGVRPVLAYYKSGLFNVPETLAPALPQQTPPTLTFPDIYVNLGAPYDKYTVTVNGLDYPFAGAWSMACEGAAPYSKSGASATFLSPTTAGTVDCVAKLHLDGSVLITGEAASSWELEVAGSQDPVDYGDVIVIP